MLYRFLIWFSLTIYLMYATGGILHLYHDGGRYGDMKICWGCSDEALEPSHGYIHECMNEKVYKHQVPVFYAHRVTISGGLL